MQNSALFYLLKRYKSQEAQIIPGISSSIRNDVFKISELYLDYISKYNIKCVRKIIFNFGVQFHGKRDGNTRCVL